MICGSGGLKARVGNSHCIVNGVGASWLLALFFMFNSSIEFFCYDVRCDWTCSFFHLQVVCRE